MVWAVPRSLATTYGIISYFLLLRLLRCFSSAGLLLFTEISRLQRDGLSHSEIWGYNVYLPLPPAYRSLSRPSSPPRAKASSMRPYLLSYVMLLRILFLYLLLSIVLNITVCTLVSFSICQRTGPLF